MKKLLLSLLCFISMAASAGNVVDVLNASVMGLDGSSNYKTYSDIRATSTAVYAAQCANSYSSIQLRSNNNNSGIVTTASGGTLKKIAVVWNSNTAAGRTLNVYGSNEPFTNPTELYNSNATKLGTIVNGTSTELEIEGDYKYLGLRSNGSAMYLEQVEITWEVEGETPAYVATPTLSVKGGTYATPQTVEVTAEEGAVIKYTLDDGDEYTYTEPIVISTTTTLEVWAEKDGVESNRCTETFIFVTPVTLAEVVAAPNASVNVIGEELTVVYQSGQYLYVKAGETYALIYGTVGKTYNPGDVIAAGVRVETTDYNGLVELTKPTNMSDGVAGTPVEAIATDITTCSAAEWVNKYVVITGVNYTAADKMLTDEQGNTIKLYRTLGEAFPTTDVTNATVYAFVAVYKETYQLYSISVTGEAKPEEPTTPDEPIIALEDARLLVACYDGAYYAMTTTIENNKAKVQQVAVADGVVVLEAPDAKLLWAVNETAGTIQTLEGKYLAYGSSTNVKLTGDAYAWSILTKTVQVGESEEETADYTCWCIESGDRCLMYRNSGVFGSYAESNIAGKDYAVPTVMPYTIGTPDAVDEARAATGTQAIYTMSGVRVAKATRGLYIVDGKKVVVK